MQDQNQPPTDAGEEEEEFFNASDLELAVRGRLTYVETEGPEKIAATLGSLLVPIRQLKPHPRNARRGDISAIQKSVRRFGQLKPIVVQSFTVEGDRRMIIVAGNHLYHGVKADGWRMIAATLQVMSDDEAEAFLIADNRSQELGDYDDAALGALLSDLADRDQLDGTGYTRDEVDEFLAELAGGDTNGSGSGEAKGVDVSEQRSQYLVLLTCETEEEQTALIERFMEEGLNVRALVS